LSLSDSTKTFTSEEELYALLTDGESLFASLPTEE
jgi:hypothetical protein